MSADELPNGRVRAAVVGGGPEALKPLLAPRAPLGGRAGVPAPSFLAPQMARLEEEISRVRKALRAERAATRVAKQQNEILRAEVDALKKASRNSEAVAGDEGKAVERLKRRHQDELSQLRAQQEQVTRELEARCAREIALLEAKNITRVNALRNSLSVAEELTLAKTERIRRLEGRLNRVPVKESLVSELLMGAGSASDLTALFGVGPVYARALRSRGILSLSQIAAWTPEDIRTIAPQIGTTEARILREEWVKKAQRLLRE